MRLVTPSSGQVLFDGRDLGDLQPYQVARLGLGYVPEDRRIFTDLTVAENLEVGRQPPRAAAPTWSDEKLFELFPALAALRRRRGSRMSGGEQQMLCIARTLAGNPTAILLDEPSEGLAPVVVEQVGRAIVELKRAGVAVLLAEQNQQFTGRIADRTYVLETGIMRSP
jgi:branched-chain amino acid transport system ATP-binding protein